MTFRLLLLNESPDEAADRDGVKMTPAQLPAGHSVAERGSRLGLESSMSQRPASMRTLDPAKFVQPEVTRDGSRRAVIELEELETLWFNTGSLCNIECRRCYVGSSPTNDRLAFLTRAEVETYLDEIERLELPTHAIGFTGGEPFVNPEMSNLLTAALARGYDTLVLTNAMRPMMRPPVRESLLRLRDAHGERLHLRVSLDHYERQRHESERGPGSWKAALEGLGWLGANGFEVTVAGRMLWDESESSVRGGFSRLFAKEGLTLDACDPVQLVLFPELHSEVDVPEITVECWRALGVEPSSMMCARSRMVVRRRGSVGPVVVACTLLPYDRRFELGPTLEGSFKPVPLNHPHCARFCVLGRGSCSAVS
jgi:hypothetical protein